MTALHPVHQSLESCLAISSLKVLPPQTCHACAPKWQPLRKQNARQRSPKGITRRSSDLWRSRRPIYQSRTCWWSHGTAFYLTSEEGGRGDHPFVHHIQAVTASNGVIIIRLRDAYHNICLVLFSGPICCSLLCQT